MDPKRKEQLSEIQKKILIHQGYRFVGSHSAVKNCEWTKKSLRGEGNCYKCTFYGIRSHQCLQMTTSMFCASRCKFCWRGQKAPIGKTWYGPIDSPEHIINHSIEEHLKLLTGFGSNLKTNDNKKEELKDVRHVALSLTGEPITYPLINEILDGFHKRRISTFLVTNAQFPEEIGKIKNVTQLYLSIDAPTKEKLKSIDKPLFNDYWERMNKCLDLLSTRRYRTCIRLSLIKYENMENFEEYAKLISKGSPDFVELKSYMWVGESQKNYKVENMPYMEDMKIFMENLLEFLPDYEYLSSHEPSRAILLGKKSLNKKHWINFPKFFELVNSNKDYVAEDYSSEVMQPNK
ncbi:MAG: hypothetical protein QJ16_C0025G0007 [archaeon GW2011_AR1]|nr:MAG: hypothetical protein QJ16_C0025G0007 [archaeon GW2011_AR1]